jgi:hypothetical protein
MRPGVTQHEIRRAERPAIDSSIPLRLERALGVAPPVHHQRVVARHERIEHEPSPAREHSRERHVLMAELRHQQGVRIRRGARVAGKQRGIATKCAMISGTTLGHGHTRTPQAFAQNAIPRIRGIVGTEEAHRGHGGSDRDRSPSIGAPRAPHI